MRRQWRDKFGVVFELVETTAFSDDFWRPVSASKNSVPRGWA
jgi:hypothetical protein